MDILWIIVIIIALGVTIGIPYVKGAKEQCSTSTGNHKWDYVTTHLHKFEPKEQGSTLKKQKIYLVSYKKMGL